MRGGSFRGAIAVAPLLGEDRLGSKTKPLLKPGKGRVLPVEM
jgi:hypothetical protein